MKLRYLLMCLFITFSNLFSSDGNITVKMKARVLDPTDLYLEVIPITNTIDDGSKMYFDFGELVKGGKQELVGRFQARLMKEGVAQRFENVKVSLIKENSSQEDSKIVSLLDQTELAYTLNGELGEEKRKYSGNIKIIADTSKGSSLGTFIDNNIKIKVSVVSK